MASCPKCGRQKLPRNKVTGIRACKHCGPLRRGRLKMLNKVDEESRVAAAINTIVSENHESNVAMGWWNDAKTGASLKEGPIAPYVFATKLALVHSELSEALEGIRKDTMDDHLPHRKSGEVELADAVIRIFDLAGALGYDLGGAYAEKRVYNSQRADHKKEARLAAGGKQY